MALAAGGRASKRRAERGHGDRLHPVPRAGGDAAGDAGDRGPVPPARRASAERLFEGSTPSRGGGQARRPGDRTGGRQGRVVFDNVSFAFQRPDGQLDPPAIKNINLTIEPGERVGILGATGAGKSALVNLLPRFYDVTEGRITIDGIDVRDFPQDNLRQVVGIALQEAVLFQGDVRFNLKFGAPDVDDDVMIGAAEAADADGFIDNLPEKYDAPVARRGYNFSGGQRQRLSMARALTPEPRILVLDDSTSALDVATESRVQAAIPQFGRRRPRSTWRSASAP